MPALVFLNKRWRIGSDDLVLPGCFELLLRLIWLSLAVTLLVTHEFNPSCSSGTLLLRIYLIVLCTLLLVLIMTTILLIRFSAKGVIMEEEPRKPVAKILLAKLVLVVPEAAATLAITVLVADGQITCPDHQALIFTLIAVPYIFFLIFGLGTLFMFEEVNRPVYTMPLPGTIPESYYLDTNRAAHYTHLWEKRCKRMLCCCTSGTNEVSVEALKNIADILASLFEDNELVMSDIAAGLVLLRLKQKYAERTDCTDDDLIDHLSNASSAVALSDPGSPNNAASTPIRHQAVEKLKKSSISSLKRPETIQEDSTEMVNTASNSEPGPSQENGIKIIETRAENGECSTTQGVSKKPSISDVNSLDAIQSVSNSDLPQTEQVTSQSNLVAPSHITVEMAPPFPWMTVNNAAHYMKFAHAAYGCVWYICDMRCKGIAPLWPFLRCCTPCCCRTTPEVHRGDNSCMCKLAAMRVITGLAEEDFVYIQHSNKLYEVPFFVAVDNNERSIVIAIRGTLSFSDAVTDITAQTTAVYGCSNSRCIAHKGMVISANYIYQTLNNSQEVKDTLLRFPDYRIVVTGHSLGAGAAALLAVRLRGDRMTPSAGTCGSQEPEVSGGASVDPTTSNDEGASFVGQVKPPTETDSPSTSQKDCHKTDGESEKAKEPEVPNSDTNTPSTNPATAGSSVAGTPTETDIWAGRDVVCFAFSPPGGLCSQELAQVTKEFVMSVVVGDDMVPRLSVHSLHRLRGRLVRVLKRCNQPKYQLLAQGCWFFMCGISESNLARGFHDVHGDSQRRRRRDMQGRANDIEAPSSSLNLLANDSHPRYESTSVCDSPNTVSPEDDVDTPTRRPRHTETPLCMPGHVLHLRPTAHTKQWRVVWRSPDYFRDVVVSRGMIIHHLPPSVLHALENIVQTVHET